MKILRVRGEVLVLDADPPVGVGLGRVFCRRDVILEDKGVNIPSLETVIREKRYRDTIAAAPPETRFAILENGLVVQIES